MDLRPEAEAPRSASSPSAPSSSRRPVAKRVMNREDPFRVVASTFGYGTLRIDQKAQHIVFVCHHGRLESRAKRHNFIPWNQMDHSVTPECDRH